MNFTKTDLLIFFSMSIAVVALSFTMPALGMTGDSVQSGEIPEYNSSAYQFDIVGEFPQNPQTPSSGVLIRDYDDIRPTEVNTPLKAGGTTSGIEMTLFENQTNQTHAKVNIVYWNNGNDSVDTVHLEPQETYHYKNQTSGWHVFFDYSKIENANTTNQTMYVDWELTQQPSDTAWYARIPILGGIVSAGDQLAGIVGWIGTIIWWVSTTFLEITINVIGSLLGVLVFLFGTIHWLVSTYTGIIAGASAWASVFVALPGILLSLELGKMVLIGIKLLPTT